MYYEGFCRRCFHGIFKKIYSNCLLVNLWSAASNNITLIGVFSTLSASWQYGCEKQSSRGVLGNFTKLTGKHLCHSLFFNKVAVLRPATLLKNRLWHRCFSVNFVKFLRTPFCIEHLWWLLLACNPFPVYLLSKHVAYFILCENGSNGYQHFFKTRWPFLC